MTGRINTAPMNTGPINTGLIKRSFSVAGHRTSVALEQAFWDVLRQAAFRQGRSLSGLVAAVDAVRVSGQPLASSLRLAALAHLGWPDPRTGPGETDQEGRSEV